MKHVSRRQFLSRGVSVASVASVASAAPLARVALAALPPAGVLLTPEQEVGPFYLGDELIRANIREDRTGTPLRLRLVVLDSRTGAPVQGAAIDLWHCDAMGLYSGFTKSSLGPPPGEGGPPPGFAGPDGSGSPPPPPGSDERPGGVEGRGEGPRGGPPPAMKPMDKLTFLRGIQMTGPDGGVQFETIFPGFYQGRVNHIHFKVRLDGHREGRTYAAGHTSHVGQVFFPEDWNARLMANGPYAEHKIHRTTDKEDGIFNGQGGHDSLATLIPADPRHPEAGLIAELRVGVDPTATPKPVGMGGGPRPRARS